MLLLILCALLLLILSLLRIKKDTLICSYRVIAKNGIKAIDLAIKEFEDDYHHNDIDVVGLVRSKEL